MQKGKENNFAYIDGQNLNLGVKSIGWDLDFRKFRLYLQEKYGVSKAYYFVGFVAGNQKLYDSLQEYGYILTFKPVVLDNNRNPKGNIDADIPTADVDHLNGTLNAYKINIANAKE